MSNLLSKLKNLPAHKVLLIAVICYFLIFGAMMAQLGGQPDSGHHHHFAGRFSQTWGIPEEEMQSPFVFTGQPYLYYWTLGAVTKIIQVVIPAEALSSVIIWRATTLLMSAGTVYYLYLLVRKVTANPYSGVLGAFFLANTLMFVFVSGGVNYDNLMNLASMAAIYHLVNTLKREDFVQNTALMGLWLSLGAVTKKQSLLLAFLIFLIWAYFIARNYKHLNLKFNRANLMVIAIFIIGLGLLIGLYGVNYVRYSSLTPGCRTIKSANVCTRFAHRRDEYSPIDYQWLWFIRNHFIENPFQYTLMFWSIHMLRSIWGILSHNTFVPMVTISLHGILSIWGIICMARFWRKEHHVQTALMFLLMGYLVYVFRINYISELQTNFLHYGIQGRYFFPVIGIYYALLIDYVLRIHSPFIKKLTISLAIMLYFAGGLGVFITRYSEIFVHWRINF